MKKGFTLFEIMVVMSIGLLLMSIVLFSISSARMQSRDGKRIADINQIRLALEQFYDACGQYPPTITNLSFNGGCSGQTTFSSFLIQTPVDPVNNGTYYYRYYAESSASTPTECFIYHVGARLENSSHSILSDQDAEVADSSTISAGTACTGTGSTFSGIDPVYDAVPNR